MRGTLSPAEQKELEDWIAASPLHKSIAGEYMEEEQLKAAILDAYSKERIWQRLSEEAGKDAPPAEMAPVRRMWFTKRHWIRYAAAAIILFGSVAYFWNTPRKNVQVIAEKPAHTDIAPGGNKAMLTLADGTKITLDSAANGDLAQQGSAHVVKLANGQIAYNINGPAGKELMWNTMSTPAGGQYQLTLPDGTKAWLNAASAITYPAAFVSGKREVRITGEVYLEIAQDKQKPFIVDVNHTCRVEVLGTSFNVNSYDNEPSVSTTLLQGSVRIVKDDQSAVLSPGQQAVITGPGKLSGNAQKITVKKNANTDQAMAWKNGFFDFDGMDLKAIMRQLERWYDIRVRYEAAIDNSVYGGKVYRNANLSDVLDILQKMGGYTFTLKGKDLIVK
ncbi:MAG: FecR domain-containing protein [Bacteroidetes bacterium]|nr:FecR domain-containing protein [Bacteroidota bacterium]